MRAEQQDRVGDPTTRRRRPLLFIVAALLALGLLGLALQAVLRSTAPVTQPVTLQPATPAPEPPAQAAGSILAPVAPADTQSLIEQPAAQPPLPALEHSDPEVRATLSDVLPPVAQAALAPDELLRRTVVLASNFARGKLLRDKLPLPAPAGKLAVTMRGDRIYLSATNHARYDALADAAAQLDADAVARWFTRYEPLLQEAWKELGAEQGDVRGAVLAGLDLMLAAPDLEGEIELVQPSVFYKYADPALEALPDTQKLLIRVGPNNRMLLKERARRLRDALALR
jgi:Protein of unknown function (DUF3014)